MTPFMQTEKWAEFQKVLGADYFKIGDFFIFKYKLPFGKYYFYIPRADFNAENLKNIINKIRIMNPVFLRIEPEIEEKNNNFAEILINAGLKKINQESQPSKTLILNLDKPEKDILDDMHHKTRYNIRVAEKNNIKIEIKESLTEEEFEIFWELIKKTSQRDKFTAFNKEYYKKLLYIFSASTPKSNNVPCIKIFLAKLRDKIIAAAVVMFYGETVAYLHGASDYDLRKMMAPHLLQWTIVCDAKKTGFRYYDFWGISETKWPGVTRFKKGFGGKEIEYTGTWDYVFNKKWYYPYKILKKIKQIVY